MAETVRLAVVGAGIMGANHTRVATGVTGAEVVYVVDPDEDRARTLADSVGAKAVPSIDDVAAGDIDAAVVAVPTPLHLSVAVALVRRGLHLLVEKPLAGTAVEADEIVVEAGRAGVTLMVGHVERFNPAVLELDHIVRDPIHLEQRRIGPYSPRVVEGVVLDLMIHDLDIAVALVRRPVVEVRAMARTVRSASEDLAVALLTFDGGASAAITASRIGQQKVRELVITQADNVVTVDLLRQDVTVNRVDHSEFVSSQGARYRQTGVVEIPFLEHRGEPLALELADFVRSVESGRPPRVDGRAGADAVRLAERVLAAAGAGAGRG